MRQLRLHRIPISSIRPNPIQPKDRSTTDRQVAGLFERIGETGYIAPIVVAQPDRKVRDYIVCDGHRRLKVAEMMQHTEIDCVILPTSQREPEIWFVMLNADTRTITGKNWFYCWALAARRSEVLKQLKQQTRDKIDEMISIFGRQRAIEIGETGKLSADFGGWVIKLVKLLMLHDLSDGSAGQKRAIGEWVLRHNQSGAIQKYAGSSAARKDARRFHDAIQLDQPLTTPRGKLRRNRTRRSATVSKA